MSVNATDLPPSPPAPGAASAEAVTALYRAHALVLIAVIPTAGDGRIGVIRGNEFTSIPVPVSGFPADSGAW